MLITFQSSASAAMAEAEGAPVAEGEGEGAVPQVEVVELMVFVLQT